MRRLALMLAAACLLPLSACSFVGTPPPGTPTSTTGQKVELEATRALYMAELAYNSVATAANAVGKACLAAPALPCPISASTAAEIRKLNATALYALDKGKRGVDVAGSATIVFNVVDQLKRLVPGQ